MKKSTSIIFTGDIGFDRYMSGKWNDDDLISKDIIDFFRKADHVIANVEGALISAPDDGNRGIYFHCMDPDAVRVLKNIRADVWNIANNHIKDAGDAGIKSTLTLAAENGCLTLGAGEDINSASSPVIFDEAGGIGIISVGYYPECIPATENSAGVFGWDNMDLIFKRISEIKKNNRYCIVIAHGGDEFSQLPNPYVRDRYIKYLNYGADAVVAHHPHVPQNYETFDDGKIIFYSLGNFIFDTDYQRAHKHTDTGILLKLDFDFNGISFSFLPTKIIRGDEKIVTSDMPDIVTDVKKDEYELLLPLACRAFLEEEKRRMIFCDPEKYKNASNEVWKKYFCSSEPEGYVKGANMDLSVVFSAAQKEREKMWCKSKLENVKKHLSDLL